MPVTGVGIDGRERADEDIAEALADDGVRKLDAIFFVFYRSLYADPPDQ